MRNNGFAMLFAGIVCKGTASGYWPSKPTITSKNQYSHADRSNDLTKSIPMCSKGIRINGSGVMLRLGWLAD